MRKRLRGFFSIIFCILGSHRWSFWPDEGVYTCRDCRITVTMREYRS